MATHLVTGYAGSEHIKSEDQGSFNASFFGTGQFVMEAGNQLEASIIDNNTVRILDGDILMKGRHIRVNPDTYEDMVIENGTAGVNRCDLIVMEYSKVPETGIETATLKVLKGTATSGTATAPPYTDGDILTGAILNQMPLYKVLIEGVVLVDVVSLFDTIPTFQTLAEIYRAKFVKDCETHLNSLGILDTMEEINANTQDNQLAGALAVKELGNQVAELDGLQRLSTPILEKALTLAIGIHEFKLSGSSYTGTDLSSAHYKYGNATIYVRDKSSILVTLHGVFTDTINCPMSANYYNGVAWSGWKVVATTEDLANYLPLSGGALSGDLIIVASGGEAQYRLRNDYKDVRFIISGEETGIHDVSLSQWLLKFSKIANAYFPEAIYAGASDGSPSRVVTTDDFVVTGTTEEATLTINLD